MANKPGSNSIEHRIATGFARISTAMRSLAWELAGSRGMTPTQLDILVMLHGQRGAVRLSRVAEQMGISAPTASETVATLVGKGLVEKSRASDDARAVGLRLTADGARLVDSLDHGGGLFDAVVEDLDEEEKTVLLKLVIKMIRGLQERGEIPAQRMCVSCKYFSPYQYADAAAPHHCHLVNAPFGDKELRLDCPEQEQADPATRQRNWAAFVE